jgi:hypothetical protein
MNTQTEYKITYIATGKNKIGKYTRTGFFTTNDIRITDIRIARHYALKTAKKQDSNITSVKNVQIGIKATDLMQSMGINVTNIK